MSTAVFPRFCGAKILNCGAQKNCRPFCLICIGRFNTQSTTVHRRRAFSPGRSRVVGGAGDGAAAAGPVGVHKDAGLVQPLVRVRAKVITLRLQQVCRQSLRTLGEEMIPMRSLPCNPPSSTPQPVAVVKGEGGAEGRGGDAQLDGLRHHQAPRVLAAVNGRVKEVVQQQVGQVGVLLEGIANVAQEDAGGGEKGFAKERMAKPSPHTCE